MPPGSKPAPGEKTLDEIVDEVGLYPAEAYLFVRQGLEHTVQKLHGSPAGKSRPSLHVNGRDLCEGLRELALSKWGRLAGTVMGRWNIRRPVDFGKIVFALVRNGHMQATQDDNLDDFRDVFDFRSAFETEYRI